ncbi:ComF family protein [Polynucleobacter sp. HIN8]|uniref:ComF family protein n=1 Tax=Polynucleobacter sp. HIN8 TaxID=3047867 RepID=UPI0025734386|nr:ComF family protein [Polynucleobacter sp. HIN8]
MRWISTVTQYLIPTLCMVCENPQAKIVCHACRKRIAINRSQIGPSCAVCALPIKPHQSICTQCEKERPAFDRVVYLDLYQEPLRHPLHLLKYQKRLACASGFALLWNTFHQNALNSCDADVLIPVPLSQAKLAARGFNQAWEIAKQLDLPNSVKRAPNLVICQRANAAQASLSRANRTASMQERFILKADAVTVIRNRHILIVDDVLTTGSTIHSLATTLKQSGAKRVTAWTMFRTPPWRA